MFDSAQTQQTQPEPVRTPSTSPTVPTSPTKPSDDRLVFVMPESYRGGKASLTLPQEKKLAPAPAIPVAQPIVKPGQAPAKSSPVPWVMGGVGLLLGLASLGAFLYVRQTTVKSKNVTPTPVVVTPPAPVQPRPAPVPEPIKPIEPPAPVYRSGIDTDSDGLTDIEENVLYQTDPLLPDSDRDGFLDGNEVFHLYNPNGSAPGTLLQAGLIKYVAPYVISESGAVIPTDPVGIKNVALFVPTSWIVTATDNQNRIIITATTGEKITVEQIEKNSNVPFAKWAEQTGSAQGKTLTSSTTKSGYSLLMSSDKLFALVDGGDTALRFTYDRGTKATLDYLQTFLMMLNSAKPAPSKLNTAL